MPGHMVVKDANAAQYICPATPSLVGSPLNVVLNSCLNSGVSKPGQVMLAGQVIPRQPLFLYVKTWVLLTE